MAYDFLMKEHVWKKFEEFGWYPGRSIDIDYMLIDFARERYREPNSLIKNLLREFWNIRIEFQQPDGYNGDLRLNTDYGRQAFDEQEDIAVLEEIVGEKLLPVGSIQFENWTLLISFSGKCFSFAKPEFFFLGNDILDCASMLFNGGQPRLLSNSVVLPG